MGAFRTAPNARPPVLRCALAVLADCRGWRPTRRCLCCTTPEALANRRAGVARAAEPGCTEPEAGLCVVTGADHCPLARPLARPLACARLSCCLPAPHARTHARMHARTHARTHTCRPTCLTASTRFCLSAVCVRAAIGRSSTF